LFFKKKKKKKNYVIFGHGCQLSTPRVGANGREEPKLFTTNKAKHELGRSKVHG
jgi:hypothetical protein